MKADTRGRFERNLEAELNDQRRLKVLLAEQAEGLISGRGVPPGHETELCDLLQRCRDRDAERRRLRPRLGGEGRISEVAERLGPDGERLLDLARRLKDEARVVDSTQQRLRLLALRSRRFVQDLIRILSGQPPAPVLYGPSGNLQGETADQRAREA